MVIKPSVLSLSNLSSLELWIVGSCIFAGMITERLLLPAVVVIVAVMGVNIITRGYFTRTPFDLAVLGLLFMIAVTIVITALPDITRPQVYRLIAGIGLFYAIINWGNTYHKLQKISVYIIIAGSFLAVFGLVNTRWILDKLPLLPGSLYTSLPRLLSDTIHPNVLAGNLIILIPVILSFPLFNWRDLGSKERFIYLSGSFFCTLVVFFTQSRGAIFAILILLACLVSLRWRYGWLVIVLLVVFTAFILSSYGVSSLIDTQNLSGDSAAKLEGRIEIWSRGLYMVADFPFTGTGMGLYGYMADTLYPFFINAPDSVPHAHNLFLQIAVDLGLPGLISWLSAYLIALITSWILYYKNRGNIWLAGYAAGLFTSQVALGVHGLTNSVTWGMVKPAPIVWGLWGMIIGAWMIYARSNHNPPA